MTAGPGPSDRRRALILAMVLMASYAYFYEGGGWNQNTRFDLVRAIVERHTLQIDVYQDNTGDKATLGGHVYSDKAPGASLTAVPAVAMTRVALRVFGADVYSPRAITAFSYVATVAAAGVPAMVAAVCVFLIARRFGYGAMPATAAAIVCGLGTPLWAYATLLYGHALAAGCLALAFWGAVTMGEHTGGRGRAFLVGAAAGWAVVTEFPASVPATLIALFALWQVQKGGQPRVAIASMGAGLAVAAMVLLGYTVLAFGNPFHIGYTSEAGYEAMRTGIFGVNWPNARVAASLLVGPYRGLLPLAPALIAAPIGYWLLVRDRATRTAGALAAAIALFYLLMTAGYFYWDGGWSYGSRHLGPALPFLALSLAPVWQRAPRAARVLLVVLALAGVGESLVAVATTSQPPGGQSGPGNPMRDYLWPAFRSGDFPIGWQSVFEYRAPGGPLSDLERRGIPRASWNLGQLVGLRGHASLAPLALVWLAGAVFWRRAER